MELAEQKIILVEEFDRLLAGDDPCAYIEFDPTDELRKFIMVVLGVQKGLDNHHLSGVLSANVAVLVLPLAFGAAGLRTARFPCLLVFKGDSDAVAPIVNHPLSFF